MNTRRLKLQMQISVDGMVGTQTQRDGGQFNWDEEVRQYSIDNTAGVDCILLGRKTARGFIPHWESVAANPSVADHDFGKLVTGIPKIVFSTTLQKSEWPNATVMTGEITTSVNELKSRPGKDLLVYGGNSFVASLIEHDLIDEYHLLVNPLALGSGLTIFSGLGNTLPLTLVKNRAFSSGTVLLRYERLRD
jgi:dihydrofolate reductase